MLCLHLPLRLPALPGGCLSLPSALDYLFQGRPSHPAGNTVIVDIRTTSEKDSAGVPDLPSGGKLIEAQFADISDRRLRGQLRDPSAIERKVGGLLIHMRWQPG